MNASNTSPVFTPAHIGGLELRNRIVRSAAFEGMCPDGLPSDRLVDHHRAMAAGGAAMTTVAYASVAASGRTYPHQLNLEKPDTVAGLRTLTDAVHREGAAASIQIGHCGYFASKPVTRVRPIGPSRVFNTYGLTFPRVMTEPDMESVTDQFKAAARLVIEAGFDAIELHAGHGYLLSQFLTPFTNRRKDRYGGSLDNRLRFPVDVIRGVRDAVGPDYPLVAKMNLSDGFKRGLQVDEAVEVARRFEKEGLDGLVLSGGFVSKTPMYVMRGDTPFKEFYRGQTRFTKKMGLLLVGRLMIKHFPFEEAYFLSEARKVRAAVRIPLMLVGGHRNLSRMEEVVGEGFEFLAMARPLIMEPDLPNRMASGETDASACIPCNKCIATMDKGPVYCPVVEQR